MGGSKLACSCPAPVPAPLTLLPPAHAAASAEGNQIFVVVRKGQEYPPRVADLR